MYVLSCDGDFNVADQTPQCSGTWILIQLPESFDPSQLDTATLSELYGIGFVLIASPIIFSLGCKAILDFLKRA